MEMGMYELSSRISVWKLFINETTDFVTIIYDTFLYKVILSKVIIQVRKQCDVLRYVYYILGDIVQVPLRCNRNPFSTQNLEAIIKVTI